MDCVRVVAVGFHIAQILRTKITPSIRACLDAGVRNLVAAIEKARLQLRAVPNECCHASIRDPITTVQRQGAQLGAMSSNCQQARVRDRAIVEGKVTNKGGGASLRGPRDHLRVGEHVLENFARASLPLARTSSIIMSPAQLRPLCHASGLLRRRMNGTHTSHCMDITLRKAAGLEILFLRSEHLQTLHLGAGNATCDQARTLVGSYSRAGRSVDLGVDANRDVDKLRLCT